MCDRVFAFGEDSLALRLESELSELRAVNANSAETRKRESHFLDG